MIGGKVVSIVLAVVLASTLFASSEPSICENLGLGTTQMAGATVHYEKSLEPYLPVLEKSFKDFLIEIKKREVFRNGKDRLLYEMDGILGSAEQRVIGIQKSLLSRYFGEPASIESPTLYLVTQKTVKDYLRSGGRLPYHTYNKIADEVTYTPGFWVASKEEKPGDFELAIPVSSVEKCEEDIGHILAAIRDTLGGGVVGVGAALHEVVEVGLLMRGRPTDVHWRWFSDGFSEGITYHLLSKHIGRDEAERYIEGRNIEKYKEYGKDLNLLYWLSANFCIETPLECESQLSYARYAYATYEARLILEEKGIGCVRKILTNVRNRKSRKADDLIIAIRQVTGVNIKRRLSEYQSFDTQEEGIKKYVEAFNAASEKKDDEQMLINLIRLHEIRPMPFSPTFLQDYKNIALLLDKLGYEEQADKLIHRGMELFKNLPKGREAAMETFLMYALACRKPHKGLAIAESFLESNPDYVLGLLIRMLSDAEAGQIGKAKSTARIIMEKIPEEKREESLAYKYASRILSLDPNHVGGVDLNELNVGN